MGENGKRTVGISIGDVNGIGCEVALKTFEDERMLEFCTPVFFGSVRTLADQKKALGIDLHLHSLREGEKPRHGKANVVNIWKEGPALAYGEETKAAGEFAVRSFTAATEALKSGAVDVLVTAPINKNNVYSDDFPYPGHTDFLNKQLEGDALMLMVGEGIRVGLMTDHIAVKDIADEIRPGTIERKAKALLTSLRQDFGILRPKIAVLGINPHSGDNGTIGQEDEEITKPTIKRLFDEGHLVFGPYAADGFFGRRGHAEFDAVLAAYHDQGLIPFKTLTFGKGVNYTAGLERVRTSPDHGTAYDIAGKGEADAGSFKEAVFTALRIYGERERHAELTRNPLKRQQRPKKG